MNPHSARPTSLIYLLNCVIKNHELIYEMICREIVGRYKGSIFGLAWSFFSPILMLLIYTFVFSVIFKARWSAGESESGSGDFALILFAGLIPYNLFAESINRAPTLIAGNINYVKKVVFPLEVLPIVIFGASLFHAILSCLVLLLAFLFIHGYINWTIIFIPIIFLSLSFFVLGLSWILASTGVFLRDIQQTIGIFTTAIMFLSPVFYSIEALPEKFQFWVQLNPLTFIIEQTRGALIFGAMPDWPGLFIYFLMSVIVMGFGFTWFQKTRKGFSDVL
jgi:lipopolysaccharide transport system permease protein